MTYYILSALIITVIIVCAFLFVKRTRSSKKLDSDNSSSSADDFSSLKIQQIIDLLSNQMETGNNISVGVQIDIMKRLIDITYFEYDVSVEDRKIGVKLIPAIVADIEESLEPHPDSLEQFRQAYKFDMSGVKTMGYGSLSWKIGAPGMSKADIFKIIIDPSSGTLIPDFLVTLRDNWASFKPVVLGELILDRRRATEHNAVLILSGLVSGYDLVAWNVLTEEEREALLNVSKDYDSARQVLVKYDLLPKDSGTILLTPTLEKDFIELMVIVTVERPPEIRLFLQSEANLKEKYGALNDDLQHWVAMLVGTLRLKLWMDLIQEVYGELFKNDLKRRIMENFVRANKLGFEWIVDKFFSIDDHRSKDSHGPDHALAAVFTDRETFPGILPEKGKGISEDEELDIVTTIASVINFCRVRALQEYRHMLRYYVKYPPTDDGRPEVPPGVPPWTLPEDFQAELPEDLSDDMSDDMIHSLYIAFGSWAPKVEQRLLLEDWIGYTKFRD